MPILCGKMPFASEAFRVISDFTIKINPKRGGNYCKIVSDMVQ